VILPDVNVLVYAFRQEAPEHERYAAWLGVYGEFVRKTGLSRDGRRRVELPVAATVS